MTSTNPNSYTNITYPFLSRHFETILPSIFGGSYPLAYSRERINLTDGDFLDLDWVQNNNDRLVILSHGLEGSSNRHYIKRSAEFFSDKNWDILAWNNRGCSGEPNRNLRLYHHGSSDDLSEVIDHALTKDYKQIVLIGFSMGGSHVTRYLSTTNVDERIICGIGYSVTFDFGDMMVQLERPFNFIYKHLFLSKMKARIKVMKNLFPDHVNVNDLNAIHDFHSFNKHYAIEINNFESLYQFYFEASPINYIDKVTTPLLIVTAKNDPLMGVNCYPTIDHPKLQFETPTHGGHLGFFLKNNSYSYMELRSEQFINSILS
ncbi:MAG: alpha/beta fold hydrolase [Reichenbachiella sp.]